MTKHAPGAATALSLRVSGDQLLVQITNDAPTGRSEAPAGARQGLIGMRQRVELYGGSLTAEADDDGGFGITAIFTLDDNPVRVSAEGVPA